VPLKLAAPRVGCIGMSMSTLTIKCACCGEPLTAPERTEYVDAHRVRHVWKCEPCNYSFSATIAAPKRRQSASLQTSE
jgi:hypothetical protein